MLFKRKKNDLSVNDMIKIEDWLLLECDPQIRQISSEEELSNRLKLKVEYVDANHLSKHVEAELRPIDDNKYNGLIRVSAACLGKSFAYLHEIMHYIYDVGIGRKVDCVFTRMERGHTEGAHEQEINYMTAAFTMRYDKIEPRIRIYDESNPKMDAVKFIDELCKEYGQPRSVVVRRIQEIRRIRRRKG